MMKKNWVLFFVMLFGLQGNAYGENAPKEYADPLKNPWVISLEESWSGNKPIKGEGMTFKLKVPSGDVPEMTFDLWQMDMAEGVSTNLVLHPVRFHEGDPSFDTADDAIYKTALLIKGELEVFLGNEEVPYMVQPREAVHLMPGTPHRVKAAKESVVMIFCYGGALSKDKDRNFLRAYFDKDAGDEFTTFPALEEITVNYHVKDRSTISPYRFSGPNNEIRPSQARGYIFSKDFGPDGNRYLKVAAFESDNTLELVEFEWSNFWYYPHEHKDMLEFFIITQGESTFWVGAGKGNGQCDTSDSNFGKMDVVANSGRMGDGVRVGPGDVIYIPPGVPHTMDEVEEGAIWYATAYPIGWQRMLLRAYPNMVYKPMKKEIVE